MGCGATSSKCGDPPPTGVPGSKPDDQMLKADERTPQQIKDGLCLPEPSTQLADSSKPETSTPTSEPLEDLTPSEIQRMFVQADVDKSGKVSNTEFKNYLGADKYKTMFKLNRDDADKDGKLSFDEFLSAVWLRPLFADVDVDLSDQLSIAEVQSYFQKQGKNKMAAIFALNRSDADNDRKITFEEFRAMVYLRPFFDEVDKENKGKVRVRELKEYLKEKGKTKIVEMFTKDDETEIDYEEFEQLMVSKMGCDASVATEPLP